mgnify:CR=1 FL=1
MKVHPELLVGQKLPPGERGERFWRHRYESINDFEKHIARNGCTILKFFLNVSRAEQKERFLERLKEPDKNWKFSEQDVKEREFWDNYMKAFEDALRATSRDHAPWYAIPADNKWVARALVAAIITKTIRELPLEMPTASAERRKSLDEARRQLENEKP